MKIKFLVTVTIGPNEPQNASEFIRKDGKAMIPYLKGKIQNAIQAGETWQYNALVKKINCTHL